MPLILKRAAVELNHVGAGSWDQEILFIAIYYVSYFLSWN
jgi:hypothetical protein